MKKFLLVCCVLIVAPILITSCSKDDNGNNPTPTTSVGYFHLGESSKWVYSNYELNWNENNVTENKLNENDTLTLQSYQQVLGKSAMIMQHHCLTPIVNTVNNASYSMYEDETTNQLFVSKDFLQIFLPELLQNAFPMITFEKDWYLFADYNSTKEHILDSFELLDFAPSNLFETLPLLEEYGIKFNGKIKLGIKKVEDKTISSGDITSINANTYQFSMYFEGEITSTDPDIKGMLDKATLIGANKFRTDFAIIDFYLSGQSGLLGILSPARELSIYSVIAETAKFSLNKLDGFEKRLINLDAKKKD